MNKRKIILMALVLALFAGVLAHFSIGTAKLSNDANLRLKLRKPDLLSQRNVGYNTWGYEISNNGVFMNDEAGGGAGGEFPRGTGRTIVFSGGFWVGALRNGHGVVSESQPSGGGTEFYPGRIANHGQAYTALTAENGLASYNVVYVIDYLKNNDDYANWPSDAPRYNSGATPGLISTAQTWSVFNDLNKTLVLDQAGSKDPVLGLEVSNESFVFNAGPLADVVFMKFNIHNVSNAALQQCFIAIYMDPDVYNNGTKDLTAVDTTLGLGLCYNAPSGTIAPFGCVGLDFFQGPVVKPADIPAAKRQALINKFYGNKTILKYDNVTNEYKTFTFTDSSFALGATGFVNFQNGQEKRADSLKYLEIAGVIHGYDNNNYTYTTGKDQPYNWPGDPTAPGAGTDPNLNDNALPGGTDQRMLHTVGPFTLAADATQEIWCGIVGGSSGNRISAIKGVKAVDKLAQATFNAGLVAPSAPDLPLINATALDGKVTISWSNNAELSQDLYGSKVGITTGNGYSQNYRAVDFQGYRVWKSLTGLAGSFEKLAEYDLIDGVTSVTNIFSNSSGLIVAEQLDLGTDAGLNYVYSDNNVTNGIPYYYGVTAYDYQPYNAFTIDSVVFGAVNGVGGNKIPKPTGFPISLETSPTANAVRVVPMKPVIGTNYNATVSDTVGHTNPFAAKSDGSAAITVVDPTKVKSGNYSCEFFTIPASTNGHPLKGTTSKIAYRFKLGGNLIRISSRVDDPATYYDFNADNKYTAGIDSVLDESTFGTNQASTIDPTTELPTIVDGMKVIVYGPSLDFKQFQVIANAAGTLPAPDMGTYGFNGSGFPFVGGFDRPQYPNKSLVSGAASSVANGNKWGIVTGGIQTGADGPTSPNLVSDDFTYPFFVNRTTRNATTWGNIVPYDFEIRFTAAGGQAFFNFNSGNFAAIPFELWNIGINTPTNTADDYRVLPWILDDDNSEPQYQDVFNTTTFDGAISGGANDPYTDWIYWRKPSNTTPGHAGYDAWVAAGDGSTGDAGYIMARMSLLTWNGTSGSLGTADPTYPANLFQAMPGNGTIFRIISTKTNQVGETFAWTGTANSVTTTTSSLKAGLKNIKAVPNPYYGRSTYQASLFDKKIKFTNLPAVCTIKIFTVAGDLVNVINHNNSSTNDRINTNPLSLTFVPGGQATSNETWDLKNFGLKYVASGMYVALIDAPGIGKTTVKFAVIQEEVLIPGFDQR